jgi:hypothetical protein
MRIDKHDIPAVIEIPGATARQLGDFGQPAATSTFAAEYFSLGAGTDIAPLLRGLDDDACQAPHWGYMISGEVVVTYTGDREPDTCVGGDVFFWPAGHSVRVMEDAEVILFSPHEAHAAVMDHMRAALAA